MKDSSSEKRSPISIVVGTSIASLAGLIITVGLLAAVRLWWEALKFGWTWGGFF